DYPVQRIRRQTRCVTLYYADKMHLDVTPALRNSGTAERESFITHAKGPQPSADDSFVDMNAYGFAEWYRERTPLEARMAEEFHRRWRNLERSGFRAEAEVDDVPDQADFVVKNVATLALQLIKRFRNIVYAGYSGRIPPSVMLSFYAGRAAQPNTALSVMVIRISKWIIADIENATLYGKRLHVTNPVCEDDVFTDRWPESVDQQNEFARHLRALVDGLEKMRQGEMFPDDMMEWLRGNFGDRVVTRATENIAAEVGDAIQNSQQLYTRRGGLIIPKPAIITGSVTAATVTAPTVAAAKPHTFFGKKI
ncbi:nucleotidyltransferase, partial [Mesorhizobium sp. M1A.F.Ca.IN.020.32.1.1]